MDAFALLQIAHCRTLEVLARGTGLRGDATRAPMQARNRWRLHRRRLTQPASPSKDDRFRVQTMGSTSKQAERALSWRRGELHIARSFGKARRHRISAMLVTALGPTVRIFFLSFDSVVQHHRSNALVPRGFDSFQRSTCGALTEHFIYAKTRSTMRPVTWRCQL
jgi:hypothetical protein